MARNDWPFYVLVVGILVIGGMFIWINFSPIWFSPTSTGSGDTVVLTFVEGNDYTSLESVDIGGSSGAYRLSGGHQLHDAIAETEFSDVEEATLEIDMYFTTQNPRTSIKVYSGSTCVINWTQDGLISMYQWHRVKIIFNSNSRRYSVYVDGIVKVSNGIFLKHSAGDIDQIDIQIPLGPDNEVYFVPVSFTVI